MSITEAGPFDAAAAAEAPIDAEELARQRRRRVDRIATWVLPIAILVGTLVFWEWRVWVTQTPHYILPAPSRIWETLMTDGWSLLGSLTVTLTTTGAALTLAIIGGAGLAILFSLSRWAELSFYPYAITLQVTPVIAIAPLLLIYAPEINLGLFTIPDQVVALLFMAWIVAFFPILSSTTLGLASVDHNLRDLFHIYGATRWQKLRYLQIPSALPYFLGGLRIGGGLSLIGAVVAEFAAGTGGRASGLAFRILESSYRLNIPRMFAALFLIALTGVLIFAILSFVSHLCLRKWHESAIKREI
ncbi:MAG: ABC transporter permease subunit [Pseudomonadota bacterium]